MAKIACVQSNVVFGDPEANTRRALAELVRLKAEGVDLAIFPEAFLTGYCVDCQEDANRIAIGQGALAPLEEACARLDIMAIVGFAEAADGRVYNSAALIEPGVPTRFYRKAHLPHLGLDRFVVPGDELKVHETRLGRIGILICFDLRIPEAARTLALNGAELIVLPTNWPEGAEVSADHVAITRAAENRVFVAACNRVGEENGFTFIGRSKIIGPSGRVLASADAEEATIAAEADLAEARNKRTVTIPGKYETDGFATRQPRLYSDLSRDLTR